MLFALRFVVRATLLGLSGLTTDLSADTHLYAAGQWVPNVGMFGHMMLGALITLFAPFQLIVPLRRKFPAVHRWMGYIFFTSAVLAATGGLIYIVLRRTIGGPVMDFAFAGYGVCVLVAAFQTVRYARARDFTAHEEWGLRIFILAMGSWLYRVQYTVWGFLFGGLWMAPGYSGPFDYFQDFAFYVPYLIALEIYFRARRNGGLRLHPALVPASAVVVVAALLVGSGVLRYLG